MTTLNTAYAAYPMINDFLHFLFDEGVMKTMSVTIDEERSSMEMGTLPNGYTHIQYDTPVPRMGVFRHMVDFAILHQGMLCVMLDTGENADTVKARGKLLAAAWYSQNSTARYRDLTLGNPLYRVGDNTDPKAVLQDHQQLSVDFVERNEHKVHEQIKVLEGIHIPADEADTKSALHRMRGAK